MLTLWTHVEDPKAKIVGLSGHYSKPLHQWFPMNSFPHGPSAVKCLISGAKSLIKTKKQLVSKKWLLLGVVLDSLMDSLSCSAPLLLSISFRNISSKKPLKYSSPHLSWLMICAGSAVWLRNNPLISLFKEGRDSAFFAHVEGRMSPMSWKNCWHWQGQGKAPSCQRAKP